MNLLQQLRHSQSQKPALQGESSLSYLELIHKAEQLRLQHPNYQGQNVALHYQGLADFLVALVAFDGWCQRLYLLPEGQLDCPSSATPWPAQPQNALSDSKESRLLEKYAGVTQWYLATSGTTGTPKWIGHSIVSLTKAVKQSASTEQICWALCYQPFRFAGLQVLLQSLLSGACLVDCSQGDAFERLARMQSFAVSAISATPSLWRQLLMTNQLGTLRLSHLTLGGEIADQSLLTQLKTHYPHARLLHVYASTEAGVGFAVADGQAGFPATWLQSGINNLALRQDAQGHLWLKPAQLPSNLDCSKVSEDGFINSEDVVYQQNDRILFLGRSGGIINVGGNKVHPEFVEQVLLEVPGVLQAHVYGKASSVLGQLVVADLVCAEHLDPAHLQKQVMAYCIKHLERYQRPTRIHWVKQLLTQSSGKLARKQPHV